MKPPNLRSMSCIAILGACLAASVGCSGKFRTCVRLRTGNDAQGLAAEQCNRECKRGHEDVEYEYLRCLQACPGVVITQNDRCHDSDHGPGRICRVTDLELEGSHATTPGMTETLAGVAGLAMIGLAAAAESGSTGSTDSDSETTSSSSSASTSAGARSKPRSSPGAHKPAQAGRSHKPAKAAKGD